jgi:para-nitrobenzyl esterase
MSHWHRAIAWTLFSLPCLAATTACSPPPAEAPGLGLIAADPLSPEFPVAVTGGEIRGTVSATESGIMAFRGIPFAAPPVGDLRWQPPEPVVPWEGVRDASEAGAICVQSGGQDLHQSEDCLFLNVWAPREIGDEPLPVLYWIHGGGYTGGSGSTQIYDGTRLAAEGAVVVTINYRLNVFGFMAHPALSAESPHGASGNYGLMDMVAGLEWVRDNIATFGGDPDRVTIFGESAGAGAVMSVMVMPQSGGLFHRAIAQSNWIHGWDRPLRGEAPGFASAESQGLGVATTLQVEGDGADALSQFRAVGADAVLAAANEGAGNPFLRTGYVWAPNIDGWTIPEDPLSMYEQDGQHDVPLIVGMNGNEGSLMTRGLPVADAKAFVEHVGAVYPRLADDMLAHYDVASADDVQRGIDHLVHDLYFAGPVRAHARHQAARSSPVWLYHFTREPPTAWGQTLGAHHAAELVYVFGTLTASDEPGERPLGLSPVGDYTEVDHQLSDSIRAYWLQFAATGDPNGPGQASWPAFTTASAAYLELGVDIAPGEGLHTNGAALWDQLQAGRRATR